MSDTLTATLKIASPLINFAIPLPIGSITLPIPGEVEIVGTMPVGTTDIETVTGTAIIEGETVASNIVLDSFPVNIPGTLGILLAFLKGSDVVVTLTVLSAPPAAA
jgi:hypothetical protein